MNEVPAVDKRSVEPVENKRVKGSQFYLGLAFFITVLLLLVFAGFKLSVWLEDEQRAPVQEIVVSGATLKRDWNPILEEFISFLFDLGFNVSVFKSKTLYVPNIVLNWRY